MSFRITLIASYTSYRHKSSCCIIVDLARFTIAVVTRYKKRAKPFSKHKYSSVKVIHAFWVQKCSFIKPAIIITAICPRLFW